MCVFMMLFQYCCTLYDLVTFHAGDVAPAPAATCTMPTNSIHEVITHMEKLEYVLELLCIHAVVLMSIVRTGIWEEVVLVTFSSEIY